MRDVLLTFIGSLLLICSIQGQGLEGMAYTEDFENFFDGGQIKSALEEAQIIALGENTHGLGKVFSTKVELVKFLHQELGFEIVVFESGYGDAALAWEHRAEMTPTEYTKLFSSNFYYHSEELLALSEYALAQDNLMILGMDCQPQQYYLTKRLAEFITDIDSTIANRVPVEMQAFNQMYGHEQKGDSTAFYSQRDAFIKFLNSYSDAIEDVKGSESEQIRLTLEIFKSTYSGIQLGELMGWPQSYIIRDRIMFENVQMIRKMYPEKKMIVWAQNSHIENVPYGENPVKWTGHYLKEKYGDAYYSLGCIVYSGVNMNYNDDFTFEQDNPDFLAYHLNQYESEVLLLDMDSASDERFLTYPKMGMESYGATSWFIAKERFDGLLFIRNSPKPTLLK